MRDDRSMRDRRSLNNFRFLAIFLRIGFEQGSNFRHRDLHAVKSFVAAEPLA